MALDFLRQLGASAGRRAGYRLRRCPVRLPRWACPQGWAVPRVARWAGRRVRWMGWPARTAGCSTADCRRWDVAAGICSHRPSRSPARHARAASSRSGARRTRSSFVGPRAGAGLDGDVRTTMVGTDYAKGPSTRWTSSSSRTCAAIRLALGDQDLRLAQVADNLLRGITLSGHDDPFDSDPIPNYRTGHNPGGQVIAPSLSFTFSLLLAKRRFSEHLLILAAGEANENSRDQFPERR